MGGYGVPAWLALRDFVLAPLAGAVVLLLSDTLRFEADALRPDWRRFCLFACGSEVVCSDIPGWPAFSGAAVCPVCPTAASVAVGAVCSSGSALAVSAFAN